MIDEQTASIRFYDTGAGTQGGIPPGEGASGLGDVERELTHSLEAHVKIGMTVDTPNGSRQLRGFVTVVTTYLKEIKLREEDDWQWIRFEDIRAVHALNFHIQAARSASSQTKVQGAIQSQARREWRLRPVAAERVPHITRGVGGNS
ncbi:hypothetical protein VQ056_21095 [Paenibacillus sp. JTLBN-2024]